MRKWLYAALGAAGLGLTGLLAAPSLLPARAKPQADEAPPRPVALPIGQVVLFSSGVGYYQREGSVEGDARVDLAFPTTDINDLLKSMVLRDLDGGQVSSVSYDSNAPVERTLKSFAIDLTGNPTFADLLQQARGEKAEVALSNAGAGTLTGTIVGVERQSQVVNNQPIESAVLNLWCSDGMRNVKLSDVQRVRFLNPVLEGEFKKALDTLASSHDARKKAVTLRFAGAGKRRVRVGYVVETPVWKTSYRLVLGSKKDEKPYLQGWAVVENPSDEDWKDVRLSLVSGRPISFRMDLYTPLYVPRPLVTPELFAGLRPVTYDGSMLNDAERKAGKLELRDLGVTSESGAGGDGRPAAAARRAPMVTQNGTTRSRAEFTEGEALSLGESVATAASAAKLGDFFQYAIDQPVSLARQKSAMLPIVGKDIDAARVSIYNERVQAKFPLLGLRLRNTSGLHLTQGPITVFEGSSYAGDARVLDLQPNEERLISYAIDLGMEVVPAPAVSNGTVTEVKAVRGVLTTTTKVIETRVYTAKNRNLQARTLLVEHAKRNDFTLVDAKPLETTADLYRFEVPVPPGETKALTVKEERLVSTQVALMSQGDDQIKWILSQAVTSEKVKVGLRRAVELRQALAKTRNDAAELRKQLVVIEKDQERLRANLREVPNTAKAYKRYVEKFDSQESEIEKYQADLKKLDAAAAAQDRALQEFLAAFSAE